MKSLLAQQRLDYFTTITKSIPQINAQFIVLTHLLEDRPEFLEAIENISPIMLIIGIPYSINHTTHETLNKSFNVVTPSLDQLYDQNFLTQLVAKNIDSSLPVIILEIGGYFAPALTSLRKILSDKLIGVIEDTEAGHRQYDKYSETLPCPVISIARSSLKQTEDFLIGASCIYSTEKLLRTNGFPIEGKRSLTIGFGKVGRGVSHSLLRHHCPAVVYDKEPTRRIQAISEGFEAPDKESALKNAEIIYGATANYSIKGDEFKLLKSGVLLISCSSKDIEFDLAYLEKNYKKTKVTTTLDCYENSTQCIFLAASGKPINFIDGAVIGPILALAQSEIILAIKLLISLRDQKGLFETTSKMRDFLASSWLQQFCDTQTGRYKLSYDANFTEVTPSLKKNLA